MRIEIFNKELLLVTIICFMSSPMVFGQSIFENDISTDNPNNFNPYTINQVVDPILTASGISRGPGIVGVNKHKQYKAKGWGTSEFDENDYFEFTITISADSEINFANFQYTPKRSKSGYVTNYELRSSIDNYSSTIDAPGYNENGVTIDLSASTFQEVQESVTFRLYAWGAVNNNKGFSIKDFTFTGNIVNRNSLSNSEKVVTSKVLSIIEYKNGEVQFKLPQNLELKTIQIIDLQGRILHNLMASGNSISFNNLNNLNKTIYVAKVMLSNGHIITKKAIKRY